MRTTALFFVIYAYTSFVAILSRDHEVTATIDYLFLISMEKPSPEISDIYIYTSWSCHIALYVENGMVYGIDWNRISNLLRKSLNRKFVAQLMT